VTVELTGRSPIRVAAFAACCALAGVTAGPTAASSVAHARTAPLVALPGSAIPATAGADVVGAVAPARPVQAVVTFKPRNAALLHRLALQWSGRRGMSEARIRSLFAPSPQSVQDIETYLRAHGLTVDWRRYSVHLESPDFRIRAYFEAGRATITVGDKRNVAVASSPAPLKSEQADSVAEALQVVAQFLADEIHP